MDKTFLKALPKMRVFRVSLIVLLFTSAFSGWFFIEVLQTRFVVVVIGVLYASLVTISITTYMCFQIYSGKIQIPTEEREARSHALREIIASIPLLVGVALMIYFLANNQIVNIAKVLGSALGFWLLLRFVLGRLLLSKKERPGT